MSDVAAASNTTATLASTSAIDDPVVDVGGSSDGASGVLFFKTVGGRVATVVKSSATNVPEYFGTLVARLLQFPTPAMCAIAYTEPPWAAVKRYLRSLPDYHPIKLKALAQLDRAVMLAMPCVPDASNLANSPDPSLLSPHSPSGRARLWALGRMVCLDVLLNNQDRLPVAWDNEGNARNIMVAHLSGEVAAAWQDALVARLAAAPGLSSDPAAASEPHDAALIAGLGGVVPIDQAFMCPAVVNTLSTSLREKYLSHVRALLESVGPHCGPSDTGVDSDLRPAGEDAINAAVLAACRGEAAPCELAFPHPFPLAKLVPFLASEGLGDIGALGLAFVVAGVRQGVSDVAVLTPPLLASLVDAVGTAIPSKGDWEGLWAADTARLHPAFVNDTLSAIGDAASSLAAAGILPRPLPHADPGTLVADAQLVHRVASRAICTLQPLRAAPAASTSPSPSAVPRPAGPGTSAGRPPVTGSAPVPPRSGPAPRAPRAPATSGGGGAGAGEGGGGHGPVSVAELLAGSRRLRAPSS